MHSLTFFHLTIYLLYFFFSTFNQKSPIQIFVFLSNNFRYLCNNFPILLKSHHDIEDITFISVPFPVKNKENFFTMFLTFSSWLLISPKTHIILFTNKHEFDPTGKLTSLICKIFGLNRITFAGPICTNSNGIPFIREWFIQGIKMSQSKYVSFINSDIIIPSNWLNITKSIFSHERLNDKPLFLISKRMNFFMNEKFFHSINLSKFSYEIKNDLSHEIDKIAINTNLIASPNSAIDIFTFRADIPPFNPNDIPPFLMGKPAWDNWLVGYLNTLSETISFGNFSFVYHLGPLKNYQKDNSAEYYINYKLYLSKQFKHGDNSNTKWFIVNGTLMNRYTNFKLILNL